MWPILEFKNIMQTANHTLVLNSLLTSALACAQTEGARNTQAAIKSAIQFLGIENSPSQNQYGARDDGYRSQGRRKTPSFDPSSFSDELYAAKRIATAMAFLGGQASTLPRGDRWFRDNEAEIMGLLMWTVATARQYSDSRDPNEKNCADYIVRRAKTFLGYTELQGFVYGLALAHSDDALASRPFLYTRKVKGQPSTSEKFHSFTEIANYFAPERVTEESILEVKATECGFVEKGNEDDGVGNMGSVELPVSEADENIGNR